MKYVIRADASLETGAGHVMRSSAIAEELIKRGLEVVFIGRVSGLPWVHERIACLGFSQILESENDFSSDEKSDILILDSYDIPIDAEFIQPKFWRKIVGIVDDLSPRYRTDLLINPGLDSSFLSGSLVPVLSGAKYIPLRKSIKKVENALIIDPNTGLNIVITGGGSDPSNFCGEVARVLGAIDEKFVARIFSNSQIPNFGSHEFRVLPIGENFDAEIDSANLVLTTASTSSLESIAREIPTGIGCAVENQALGYKTLSDLGVAMPIGVMNSSRQWQFDIEAIHELISSAELRKRLSDTSSNLIDLHGASRIADSIITL